MNLNMNVMDEGNDIDSDVGPFLMLFMENFRREIQGGCVL